MSEVSEPVLLVEGGDLKKKGPGQDGGQANSPAQGTRSQTRPREPRGQTKEPGTQGTKRVAAQQV